MRFRISPLPFLVGLLLQLVPAVSAGDVTTPTPEENRALSRELRTFYQSPSTDPTPLLAPTAKYDARTGERVFPNAQFLLEPAPSDPLLRLAQFKATDEYRVAHCRAFNRSLYSGGPCDAIHGLDASIEKHDRVEQLTETWIQPEKLVKEIGLLPVRGKTKLPLWSSDYWRLKFGGTSHRYAVKRKFGTYAEAIAHYAQPSEWTSLVAGTPFSGLSDATDRWSPAEKYDLAVNDERFSLTASEKGRGKEHLIEGDVPGWMGVCHGWAAAAIMVAPPLKQVSTIGARGVKIPWQPSDIRALASLQWSNGDRDLNFVGGRCEAKKAATYPNGRLVQDECFDNNPATFHLALANLVGRFGHSFVMDKTFDYQVWNQPIHSYQFTYFNPLNTDRKSARWSDVAVEYDAAFKSRDRFQTPLTRGSLANGRRDDSGIRKIVGVTATVAYAGAHRPTHGGDPGAVALFRETYHYDLELEPVDGKWIPTGGEWLKNAHPDFMWIPKRGSVATHAEDAGAAAFSPEATVTAELSAAAQRASVEGYPLCKVVRELTQLSAGQAAIRCATDPDTSTWLVEVAGGTGGEPGCEKPDGPATIVVSSEFPVAQYWLQDQYMGDFRRASSRRLTTPPLKGCVRHSYAVTFHAPRLGQHGYTYQTQRRTVTFEAGNTVTIHLDHRGELQVGGE